MEIRAKANQREGVVMRILLSVVLVMLIVPVSTPVLAQAPKPQWVEHLAFNVGVSPLDNVTLRQAIASAIDRKAVYEAARGRFPRGWTPFGPAGSWYPPVLTYHDPNLVIFPYDVGAAKDLLAKAGFPDGKGLPEFEILYRADFAFRKTEAEVIAAQLAAIGIRAKAVGLATGTAFFARVAPGPGRQPQYQMAVFAWGADPNQPDREFLSDMFLQGGPRNVYAYRNPDVTLLIADILKEQDQAKRLAMLKEAERLILTDAPVVPILYYHVP